MARLQRDLRTELEWVAVIHYNADHPHVSYRFAEMSDTFNIRVTCLAFMQRKDTTAIQGKVTLKMLKSEWLLQWRQETLAHELRSHC